MKLKKGTWFYYNEYFCEKALSMVKQKGLSNMRVGFYWFSEDPFYINDVLSGFPRKRKCLYECRWQWDGEKWIHKPYVEGE